MGKKAKCLADGGVIGGDGLTDAQRAKINGARASLGVSDAQPATSQPEQRRQQAQALPQQQGISTGIIGILKGRQAQIDKAAGYAEGGIVRGKGGVDNVPMEISGTKVNLTGGKLPEAVLPGKTVQALGGPAAVESLIEETNGKPPVRDGLKAGGSYANGLVIEENDPRLKPFSTPAPSLGSGLAGMSQTIASSGVAPYQAVGQGRDANGIITADSAAASAGNPMTRSGGISGGIDMAGVNGVLHRENKARGEMIDSMVNANGGNGVAILGGDGQTETDKINAERTARWRQDDLIAKAQRGNQGAIAAALNANSHTESEAMRTAGAMANEQARGALVARGQDMNALSDIQRNILATKTLDHNISNDAQRIGIDRSRVDIAASDSQRGAEKWGVERGVLQGQAADAELQRSARTAMNNALATGDAEAYKKARQQGIAAGLKFDEDKTQKPMEIADPNDRSGLKKILVQPNSDGTYTQMRAADQQKPAVAFGKADVDAALKAGAPRDAVIARIKSQGKNPADFGL